MLDVFHHPIVVAADRYAVRAHGGQLRPYTGLPYITHPHAAARLVAQYLPGDVNAVAAALLHDVQDSRPHELAGLIAELEVEFNSDVASLVNEVSDHATPDHGNRAARKAWEARRLATISSRGKSIRLADTVHNVSTIVANDPDFARVYLVEKAANLESLQGGHPALHSIASKVIGNAMVELSRSATAAPAPRRRHKVA